VDTPLTKCECETAPKKTIFKAKDADEILEMDSLLFVVCVSTATVVYGIENYLEGNDR